MKKTATTTMTSATVAGSAGPVVKGLGRSRSNYSPVMSSPLSRGPVTSPFPPLSLSHSQATSLAFTLSILLIASGVAFLALAFSPLYCTS